MTKLLNIIHAKHEDERIAQLPDGMDETDLGHTVKDVAAFCKLFNAKMHAFEEDGTHIYSVFDGKDRHPLIFTNAQNHMYWHCSTEAINSLSSCARTVRNEGGKSYKPQLEQTEQDQRSLLRSIARRENPGVK